MAHLGPSMMPSALPPLVNQAWFPVSSSTDEHEANISKAEEAYESWLDSISNHGSDLPTVGMNFTVCIVKSYFQS